MTDTPRPTPDSAEPPADGYLWDRSAPVDAEVLQLEQTLEPLHARPRGFAGVEKAASARRRMVILRRLGMAVAAVLVIGVAVGWWWTGRPLRSGEDSPWKFVAGRGVRVRLLPNIHAEGSKGDGGDWMEVRTSDAGFEMRSPGGSIVTVEPHSRMLFLHRAPSWAPRSPDLRVRLESGVMRAECGRLDPPVTVSSFAPIELSPGAVVLAHMTGDGAGSFTLESGHASVYGGTVTGQRLIAPMIFECQSPEQEPTLAFRPDAPELLIMALRRFRDAGLASANADARVSAAREAVRAARPEDVVTLWNIAFPSDNATYYDADREFIVNGIGRCVNGWPPGSKKSKIPFWDRSFAEDWWTLIKESMAEDNKHGSSKQADEDAAAMKLKQDESAKLKAEEAAKAAKDKEAEEAKSKQPDAKVDPKSEPVQKSAPKGRGK